MATKRTGRPKGRPVGWRKPRPVVDVQTEAERAAWYPEQWEALLDSEGLSMSAGMLPASSLNLRETDRVSCLECIGYHTHDEGCYYHTGEAN